MKKLRRIPSALALIALTVGLANAATIGNLSAASAATNYSLTLQGFDTLGGTRVLDSVQLYFYAGETLTTLTLTSTDATNTNTFDMQIYSNFVRNFANSAVAANKFTGQTLQVFDTGIGASLGNCSANPATTVPDGCNPIVLGPLQAQSFAPVSINNTQPSYGLAVGTGVQGLTGATLAGTNITKYIANLTNGNTFTLSGSVLTAQGGDQQGAGVNNSMISQTGVTSVQAEVDYTYHTVAALTISCAATTGTVNVLYNSTITASGGLAPYTLAIVGALPLGLNFNPATGLISGTPTAAGSFNYQVTDSQGTVVAGACGGVTINALPSLSILKTVTGGGVTNQAAATIPVAGTGSFALTVSNAGPGPTSAQVTVTDPIPAGMTIGTVTSVGNAWACAVALQSLTCTMTQVVTAGNSYPIITVPFTVQASLAGTTAPNTATEMGGGDPTPHTSTAQVTVPVQAPSLSILKTVTGGGVTNQAAATIPVAGTGSFALTVSNAGPGPTSAQVTVTDPIPAGMAIGTVTSVGNAWACAVALQNLTCTITQVVTSGNSYPIITVPFTVGASLAGTTAPNTATETGGGDPTPHTSTAQVTVPVQAPSLSILKTVTGGGVTNQAAATIAVAGTGSFALTVSNAGPGPTSAQVTVTDPIPAGMTIGAFSSVGNAWACALGGVGNQTLTCTITQVVTAGNSYPVITVPFTVQASLAGTTAPNTATETGGGDPTTHMSTAQVTVPVQAPSLSILKTVTGGGVTNQAAATIPVAGTGSFALTVSNAGPGPTSAQVTVTDPIPAGMTIGTVTSVGNAWACGLALQNLTCTITQVVAAGNSYPVITVPFTVQASLAGTTAPNTATETGGGDPTTHMSTAQVTVPVQAPSLSILKTVTGGGVTNQAAATIPVAGTGSFALTVSNAGPGPTSAQVTVTDPIPAGMAIGTVTSVGNAWACAVALQNLTCTITQVVTAGNSYPIITVPFTVGASLAGTTAPNTATETGGGDPTPHTSTAQVTVPVQAPSLSILKTVTGGGVTNQAAATIPVAGTGSFALTVSNAGPGPTSAQVTVTDPIPAGMTIGTVTSVGNAWACAVALQNLTCTITQVVTAGNNYPVITVPFTVQASLAGTTAPNTATEAGGGDPTTHMSTAQVTVPQQPPSLSILKTVTGGGVTNQAAATIAVAGTGSFALTVSNAGPGPTSAQVTVTDPIPAGMTIGTVTSVGNAWACGLAGQNLTCTITQVVTAGNTYPVITVPFTVQASLAGTTAPNTATETGGGDPTTHTSTARVTVPLVPSGPPDMILSKTHIGTSFTAGGSVTFLLVPTNIGATPTTTTVTVNDALPVTLTATAVSGLGWTCAPVPAVSCSRTDLLGAGGSFPSIQVTASIATTATGTLINNAVVGGGGEVNLTNDTATDSIPLTAIPDMTITKTHTGTSFTPGGSVTFTLTANNIGPVATSGVISVSDTLPAGLTATGISGSGWTCVLASLSCTSLAVVPSNGSLPPITVTASIATSARGTLVNNAVVGGGGEVNLTNDTATDSIAVSVPLTLTCPANTGQAGTAYSSSLIAAGGTAPYTFSITTGALPAGLSLNTSSGAITGTPASAGNPTFTAKVTDSAGVAATATSSCGITVTLPLIPDMVITKTHTGSSFAPGGSVTFTLTPSNIGTAASSGTVTVTDTLPAGLTATAISGGATWTCTLSPLSCSTAASAAVNGSLPPITLTASIAGNATGTLVNNALVGGGGEVNLTNDTTTDQIVVTGIPDMVITKTHTGTSFASGGSVTFTLTPSNIGTAASSGTVTVTDTLPAGLTATSISGSNWTCTLSPLSCSTPASATVNGSLPPISLTASIAGNATGTLVNNALVGGGGEVNLTNDTATDQIVVTGIPDMTITKSHTGTLTRGSNATYTLTASNVGQAPTSGTVTVTDTLPTGLTAVSIAGGTGWTCTLSSLSCTITAVLAPGAAYPPITVVAAVSANAPATIVNTGVVGGGGEVNLTNDTATDPATLPASPILSLNKVANGTFAPGAAGSFTILVTNTGTGPTSGLVTLTDPLPAGLTGTGLSGSGWTCVLSSFSCTRSDALAPGASYPPVTVNVNVALNAPATITNVASTTGGGAPPTASSTASATINLQVVVSSWTLSKSADHTSAQIGDVVGYTLAITNNTTSSFTGIQMQDMEPNGFQYVAGSAQLMVGTNAPLPIVPGNSGGLLTFSLGTMVPGQTDVITYRLQIGGKTRVGPNVNSAQATGNGLNGVPSASNPAHVTVLVQPGLFTTRQFLIGRVFEDLNGNGVFDKGERPVAGARIYLSNGNSAITDSKGLYNIPTVAPGSLVVALDPTTVPKGYTISSGRRKDAESWSRLVRTPLGEGAMLRQNFALIKCPYCPAATAAPGAVAGLPGVSGRPPAKLEIVPSRESMAGDGRSSMAVRVRVLDDQGNPTSAKEVRIRTSAGQFVVDGGDSGAEPAENANPLFGKKTELQTGRSTEQYPQSMQGRVAKKVQGEATFLMTAPNTPGVAHLVAESGDPDHLLTSTHDIWFTPEQRSPILVSDGEISVGRAAPEFPILGQSGQVSRRADAFLRTPMGDGMMLTLGYTSHLTLNDSNGNPGLFQMDPAERVYQVYGDSSTQYQAAQSNAHAYGRIDKDQSYVMFGDIRMGSQPVNGSPVPASQDLSSLAFSGQTSSPSFTAAAPTVSQGVGDYNRNVVGAAVHLEDSHHDFITLQGARPNTSFARDVFAGSTFGLIQLTHINLLQGSESGIVEIRDVHNPEIVLSTEQLVRNVDYTLDPYTGTVFFLRTLNAFDQALNLVQVVFTYEYQSTVGTSSVYGVRTELRINSWGTRLGLGVTNQRDTVAGSYFLGDLKLQQTLWNGGRFTVEVPVSHGTAFSAGLSTSTAPNANGYAIRADLNQPFRFMSGKLLGSFAKTDADFYNPFGTTVIPGSQTGRGSVELSPLRRLRLRLGFMDERNHTSLVNNQRQTGSLEAKLSLTETLVLTTGYDFRDFDDTFNDKQVKSNEVAAALEWKPFSKFTASVRREENLSASDPTYPNETLLSARYQASETVRVFATERLASAPITPIGDLSNTGFSALAGKNETAIGIDDKWSKYTTIQSKYLIENGINGTDTFAVIGLVNRIPLQEHLSLDLGMERGELLSGKDHSYDAGSLGFSWMPKKNFRASTRYQIRDLGGLGQIVTAGAAGRLADGLTLLGRFQYSEAAFTPGTGAVDVLNPTATNPLPEQTNARQGVAALAWRPWKTDREGILFSYTLRDANLNGTAVTTTTAGTQPQHDDVSMLSTDGYYQANKWLEFYGKFALSDRTYNYVGSPSSSTLSYLWQSRAQAKISRRFDVALEGRIIWQPETSIEQWTVGLEGGFWVTKDLRAGLGYSFKSADEIAANFLTNPVKQGVYFVLTSKLSNMFNLFDPHACGCDAPVVIPPVVKPEPRLDIGVITGGKDVCPGDDLQLRVSASGWLPDQTPVYQWSVDGKTVAGATGPTLMMSTTTGPGTHSVKVSVTAGGLTKTSDSVNVLVKPTPPPTIQFSVSPHVIAYGDKLPLAATGQTFECTSPGVIVYTASEGTVAGTTYDSNGVVFDLNNRAQVQSKVIHLTATITDKIGQKATASDDVTINLMPQARRLDDLVFAKDSDRVNNCGKRLLLEELTPMLRADPGAKVVLIGHRDTGERRSTLDRDRVLNAAAVLSAGKGICPQVDLSRVLVKLAGTDQTSVTRPALCGSSTQERAGDRISASDARAQYRRVEIWLVPSGAAMPAGAEDATAAPQQDVTAKGCPR